GPRRRSGFPARQMGSVREPEQQQQEQEKHEPKQVKSTAPAGADELEPRHRANQPAEGTAGPGRRGREILSSDRRGGALGQGFASVQGTRSDYCDRRARYSIGQRAPRGRAPIAKRKAKGPSVNSGKTTGVGSLSRSEKVRKRHPEPFVPPRMSPFCSGG